MHLKKRLICEIWAFFNAPVSDENAFYCKIEGFFMFSVSYQSVIRLLNLPKGMILSIEGNENNCLGYPYKLPRLVDGKKPYIVFYVWNENTKN